MYLILFEQYSYELITLSTSILLLYKKTILDHNVTYFASKMIVASISSLVLRYYMH